MRSSQDGADRSNCSTNCMASWSNACAVVRALHEVEQREPGKRRKLRVRVALHALLEKFARRGVLAVGEKQRGILEHRAQAGVRLRDFDRFRRGATNR